MELIEKLNRIKERFDKINQQLSDPSYMNDRDKIVALSKERSDLINIIIAFDKYTLVIKNIEDDNQIIYDGLDKELIDYAKNELVELQNERFKLEEEIKFLLLPKDPNDNKDIIMEIRA
ncbi:MAG TPA: PCRF domain-containing protein, partial [Ignavibacteriaceae bacterium]|nr:PCRF domain-containing protein [Ignavibacteriaceae bacterium]